jgi:hydroxymethylpyrimidine pyrophosphatase-like HAD family hydrolase
VIELWDIPLKAVIIDIDGCLTSKMFGQLLDIESLKQIHELSSKSQSDPSIPMIILNTGRDINYTEVMAKFIDAFHYFIIEMGAAVASIHGAQITYKTDPKITPDSLKLFDKLLRGFLNDFPQYQQYLQFGKRYMITFLFGVGDDTKEKCVNDLRLYIDSHYLNFYIDVGHNFINIIFPGLSKGTALDILFQINPELNSKNIAAIGDSTGDWDYLKRCAFSACPANGSEFLKKNCHFTSSYTEAEGVLEILQFIIKRNRYLLSEKKKLQKKPSEIIKTVIVDINGTIDSAIYGKPTNLDEINKIRALIQQSKTDDAIPKIILNTGWDLNYTALYAQLLNDFEYHIIERGSAIIKIDGPYVNIITDPRITPSVLDEIAQIQTGFIEEYPHYRRYMQVGKKYMMSFQFEMGDFQKEQCMDDLQKYFTEQNNTYEIEDGINFVNVGVSGINKGTGAELLKGVMKDFDFPSTVGIGDSNGDWDYIKKCGFKACPSNASRFLRQNCDLIASNSDTLGTIEILENIIQWNIEKMLKNKNI